MRSIDTLSLELTASCPLRCVHCSAVASPDRREYLAPGQVLACLEAARPLSELYLSGGEPFEYPELSLVLSHASGSSDTVAIYSSGTQRSATGPEPIPSTAVRAARDAGVARIDLSIYSADPKVHDSVTGIPGSLLATIESAKRIRGSGLGLGIHFVPVCDASGGLSEVAERSGLLGASRLHVLALTAQGRAHNLGRGHPPPGFLAELRELMSEQTSFELVVSSALRHALGMFEETPRDRMRSAFVDVRGFVYPAEDKRDARWKSPFPVADAAGARTFFQRLENAHG